MSAKVHTRSQKMAQAAYETVCRCKEESKEFKDYRSFALSFPALVHHCGLAQAFTFALAKKRTDYTENLCSLLHRAGVREAETPTTFANALRKAEVADYIRLSRTALQGATWIKRYVEAFSEKDDDSAEGGAG